MLNDTWRRIGYIALFIIAFIIGYGIGYSIASVDVAKWFIQMAVDKGIVNGVDKAELLEYYLKLKGGG